MFSNSLDRSQCASAGYAEHPDWATYANHSQAKRDTPQQLPLIETQA